MLKQILKLPNVRPIPMLETPNVSKEKKEVVMNLYVSGIGEEFIAMQLDLEIPVVISILKELDVYRGEDSGEKV
jgi:hypothetical protein